MTRYTLGAHGQVQMLDAPANRGSRKRRRPQIRRDGALTRLVGHGAAMLLEDRLLEESDAYSIYVCEKCGKQAYYDSGSAYVCPICENKGEIEPVTISYSRFKLLLQEDAGLCLSTKPPALRRSSSKMSKIIDSIKFGLLPPDEVRKLSAVEIQTSDTYDEDGAPIAGPYGPPPGHTRDHASDARHAVTSRVKSAPATSDIS